MSGITDSFAAGNPFASPTHPNRSAAVALLYDRAREDILRSEPLTRVDCLFNDILRADTVVTFVALVVDYWSLALTNDMLGPLTKAANIKVGTAAHTALFAAAPRPGTRSSGPSLSLSPSSPSHTSPASPTVAGAAAARVAAAASSAAADTISYGNLHLVQSKASEQSGLRFPSLHAEIHPLAGKIKAPLLALAACPSM